MAFDIYTLARASCLGECTPPIPHPGLHWREVSRCCLRSRGLKCVNLSPDRASAIAGGRKCPRLPLTFQAELRMKHVGGAALATTNSWAINGYCCMPLKLWVSLSHSKSWPIQTVSVCVCVCVCAPQSQSNWSRNVYTIYIYVCVIPFSLWFRIM